MIQEINEDNFPSVGEFKIQKDYVKNNLEKHQKITENEDSKMDIEVISSNQLNGSFSTQASNNIKSSLDSKNLNICNTNIIFYGEKNNEQNEIQIQNQIAFPNQSQNKNQNQIPGLLKEKIEGTENIFKFNFLNKEENLSFSGEYLNEIYLNLLQDEKDN